MFGLLLATPAAAEEISSFAADVEINPDASLSITEEIQYDFEGAERRGIFRNIPVSYETDTGNRRIFVEVSEVLQNGEPAQIKESREGGNLRIRIGDPDVTITGAHTYEITYNVRGALNFFDDETAELYWDVVGDRWEVPIRSASANVFLAEGRDADTEDITSRCFAGPVGSNASCENLSETTDPLGMTASTGNIQPGEAMTAVLNFPANLVKQPGALTSWWWWLQANPLVPLPLVAFIISFFVWYRWGKDPEGRGVVVTQYEPPQNLKPVLVGALIDETVHTRDITAGIIYLAEQGFIEIERIDKKWLLGSHDYILRKKRSFTDIKNETYQDLIEAVFASAAGGSIFEKLTGSSTESAEEITEVQLSDLKESQSFQRAIKGIKADVDQEMRDRCWFAPQNNKANLLLVGIIIITMALLFFVGSSLSGPSVLAAFVSIAISIGFLALMKKKTKEGAILQEDLEGFKHFLSMTQKERLDFHNAPERNPQEFMQYLPYAIALGVEDKWAKQFADMEMPEPDWYHGTGAFAATDFASDMSTFSKSYSQAASGGSGASGGSAGGGMGGGGGGSW